MATVEKTALVHHTTREMYDLVSDINAYQDFLPWCSASRLISESETEICGEIEVSRMGIRQKFSTCNAIYPPDKMHLKLKDGPFKKLEGIWQFTALSEDACKVSLQLEFEFSGRLIDKAFGRVFLIIANDLVEAFCKRAEDVYG